VLSDFSVDFENPVKFTADSFLPVAVFEEDSTATTRHPRPDWKVVASVFHAVENQVPRNRVAFNIDYYYFIHTRVIVSP